VLGDHKKLAATLVWRCDIIVAKGQERNSVFVLSFGAVWFQLLTASFDKPEINSLNFLN
jgi:hypothetical protein